MSILIEFLAGDRDTLLTAFRREGPLRDEDYRLLLEWNEALDILLSARFPTETGALDALAEAVAGVTGAAPALFTPGATRVIPDPEIVVYLAPETWVAQMAGVGPEAVGPVAARWAGLTGEAMVTGDEPPDLRALVERLAAFARQARDARLAVLFMMC